MNNNPSLVRFTTKIRSKPTLTNNSIVCIGSPLLDIIVEVDNTFLTKHNLEANSATVITNNDFFKSVITMDNCKFAIGGSITNTVRVLQAILQQNYPVIYLGAIGNDSNGKMIRKTLEKEGVKCIFKECENTYTGMCVALINGANRSLCTDLGASKTYSIQDLREHRVKSCLDQAKCIYFSAFFLGVSIDCLKNLIQLKEKIIAFNIGAVFLCKKYRGEILEILKYVDIVFGNDREAQALAEIMDASNQDIKTICRNITTFEKYKNQDRIVVTTRGADAIIVAMAEAVKEYEVKGKVTRGEIIDTNGAGDAFAGGFLAKFLQGQSIDEAVRCGIIASQEIIKNVGCSFNVDTMYNLCK